MPDTPADRLPADTPWLAVGAVTAVAVAHAGVLLALWNGTGSGSHDPSDDGAYIAVTPVSEPVSTPPATTAPVRPVAPPAKRRTPPPPAASAPPAVQPAPDPSPVADTPPADNTDTTANSAPSADAPSVSPSPSDAGTTAPAADAATTGSDAPSAPVATEPPSAPPTATASQPEQPKASPPGSAQWAYDATIKVGILTLSGNASLNWQQDGQHYQADLQYQVLGRTMQQTSNGTLSATGLQPDVFVEKGRRTVFDHDAGQMRRDGTDTGVALPPYTHDKLSVIVQLGSLLAALPDGPKPGDHWTLPVAGSSTIVPWTFRYIEEPNGPTDTRIGKTWKVAYEPQNADDDQIQIWFARRPNGLPTRLLIRQSSGNSVDLRYRER